MMTLQASFSSASLPYWQMRVSASAIPDTVSQLAVLQALIMVMKLGGIGSGSPVLPTFCFFQVFVMIRNLNYFVKCTRWMSNHLLVLYLQTMVVVGFTGTQIVISSSKSHYPRSAPMTYCQYTTKQLNHCGQGHHRSQAMCILKWK